MIYPPQHLSEYFMRPQTVCEEFFGVVVMAKSALFLTITAESLTNEDSIERILYGSKGQNKPNMSQGIRGECTLTRIARAPTEPQRK